MTMPGLPKKPRGEDEGAESPTAPSTSAFYVAENE
jgi:hypothetical protein